MEKDPKQREEENRILFHEAFAAQPGDTPLDLKALVETPEETARVQQELLETSTLMPPPQTEGDERVDTMVHTIGQMRELIMDFPASLMAANFFKAFSDGTRLRLLQALSVREMCVSDLCELLELSQPAVSNHLRVLNHQRIVKYRRSGKNIFYSLDDWHINAIIGMAMEHLSYACPEH